MRCLIINTALERGNNLRFTDTGLVANRVLLYFPQIILVCRFPANYTCPSIHNWSKPKKKRRDNYLFEKK